MRILNQETTFRSQNDEFRLGATITIISNPRHQAILNVDGFGPCFVPRCATNCLTSILSHPRIDFTTCHGTHQAEGLVHYNAYIIDNLDQVIPIFLMKK